MIGQLRFWWCREAEGAASQHWCRLRGVHRFRLEQALGSSRLELLGQELGSGHMSLSLRMASRCGIQQFFLRWTALINSPLPSK